MKITESASDFDNLDKMSIRELLDSMHQENQKVQLAIAKVLPKLEELVSKCISCINRGGRIFYLGAGTSGRLGVLDASELPTTFGIEENLVIGIIAGGDRALRKAVETAEDNPKQAWVDLQEFHITSKDLLIGLATSGTTPYVVGGLAQAKQKGVYTACITCNPDTPLSKEAQLSIEAIVGPEFVTGSTRLKGGTAQKLILNMLSTSLMIKLGRIKGNQMVDMKISNNKLHERGVRILMKELKVDSGRAEFLLQKYGSVRSVLKNL